MPDSTERLAEQMFDARAGELRVAAQLGQHILHLTLAKSEVAQRGEDLGMHVDESRRCRAAVGGAIGVPEGEGLLRPTVDEQFAAMGGSMMSRAERQEIRGLMPTPFGPRLNMVHVDECRMGAARHAATVSIAGEHGATQRRRDALLGARARMRVQTRRVHVGVA